MRNTVVIIICSFVLWPMGAQNMYQGDIDFSDYKISRMGNYLDINLTIGLDKVQLHSDKVITLVPSLIDENGDKLMEMDTIIIAGKSKAKYLKRKIALENDDKNIPNRIYARNNGHEQKIRIHKLTQVSNQYYNISLVTDETVSGCSRCNILENRYMVATGLLNPSPLPQFLLSFIEPEVQCGNLKKQLFESGLAFKSGSSDLLYDFANNTYELSQAEGIISQTKTEKNLILKSINIYGYASPEGNSAENLQISEKRAQVFADYLADKYGLDKNKMLVNGMGEDWDGLRKAVESSNLSDKNQIIDIIDKTTDTYIRKIKLKDLPDKLFYKKLLAEFYPLLRRNTYNFTFLIKPYSVDEIKAILKTDPRSLTLNNILAAAISYERNSTEARNNYSLAASMFPNEEIPNLNLSVYEIETGNTDQAINRLLNFDTAETLNNLGVAYILNSQYTKVGEFLAKSAQLGSENGINNLKMYKLWEKKNNIYITTDN